jgi:hypothetical protein
MAANEPVFKNTVKTMLPEKGRYPDFTLPIPNRMLVEPRHPVILEALSEQRLAG